MTATLPRSASRPPLWRRTSVRIAAVVLAIPVLALAWYLGSPLFLDTTVVEALPTVTEVPAGDPAEATAGATAEPIVLSTGEFVDADAFHRGSGTATILELEDGSRVLRFEGLDVTNGPDLQVILSPTSAFEGAGDVMAPGYVDLGKLKGNKGDQNYVIPAGVELGDDFTVVIYCEPFSVVFSTATLAAVSA